MGEVSIIKLPKGFKLVSDVAFEYPKGKSEKFSQVVERFDQYINEVRSNCIKKIAEEMKMKVNFVE